MKSLRPEPAERFHRNRSHLEYAPWAAYANSKAANTLLAVALDSIGSKWGVRAFAVHPGGIVDTGLLRHVDFAVAEQAGLIKDGKVVIDPDAGWKTPEMGAATAVWAATSPLLKGKGGVYLSDCEVDHVAAADAPPQTQKGVSLQVIDPVNAGRLFQLCTQLTGVRFG